MSKKARWEERWAAGEIPWDAGGPCPSLVALVQAGSVAAGDILVPGNGGGWDSLALAAPSRRVFGLDLSQSAATVFRERAAAHEGVHAVCGDFFEANWQVGEVPSAFDFVWDYTFLCALPLELREPWADRMGELVKSGGTLATLIFPDIEAAADYVGPPWPLSPSDVRGLLKRDFEEISLERATESHPGREGKEWIGRFRRY